MSKLTSSDRILCAAYGLLGLAALVGTQIALVRHISTYEGSGLGLENTVVNAAAAFSVIDLLSVALVALIFIVVEGRRLGIRFLWVYVALSFLIAISVGLPAFLIARQVKVAELRTA